VCRQACEKRLSSFTVIDAYWEWPLSRVFRVGAELTPVGRLPPVYRDS